MFVLNLSQFETSRSNKIVALMHVMHSVITEYIIQQGCFSIKLSWTIMYTYTRNIGYIFWDQ